MFTALLLLALSAPAQAQFPPPSRPVASIVSSQWSSESDRERAGEADTVIRLAGVQPGYTVADIGAGQGYYTIKLAHTVGPRGRVFAEDIVPRYLKDLKRRVVRVRAVNVTTVLGAPDDPRLRENSLDRAFLIHMYHEVQQPYALLWRLHGAMKPGGRVAVVDADRETNEHGTPPALLKCEFESVGFRQVAFHRLERAGGYLAMFEPAAPRPDPATIRGCK
ncbi:MAG: methyltransferase domain-containing protein [Sphingomonadaceae bacterium]|nr:methyltransferase domain-containing protein [Sphingomonadaceae bacterium]